MWNNKIKEKTLWLLIMAQLVLLSVSAFAQEEYKHVKIHSLHPKPIVKIELNGKPAYFLLDTGSDVNIVNSWEARKYKFDVYKKDYDDPTTLVMINGKQKDIGRAYNVHMVIGERRIFCGFLSMDISPIVKSIQKKTGISIVGIIGSDTMKIHHFIIDYEREEIVMRK